MLVWLSSAQSCVLEEVLRSRPDGGIIFGILYYVLIYLQTPALITDLTELLYYLKKAEIVLYYDQY